MKKCYTYDDVNIIPKFSEIKSRGDITLKTRFTKNTNLSHHTYRIRTNGYHY